MISKWKNIVLLVEVAIGFYCCQTEKMIRQQAIKDIYGHPICYVVKDSIDV